MSFNVVVLLVVLTLFFILAVFEKDAEFSRSCYVNVITFAPVGRSPRSLEGGTSRHHLMHASTFCFFATNRDDKNAMERFRDV